MANGARPVLCSDSGVALLATQGGGGRGGGGVEGCENPLLLKQQGTETKPTSAAHRRTCLN